MKALSVSVRLTVWYAAALLLGLGLFGVGMWFALQSRLVSSVDTRLVQRMDGLRAAIGEESNKRVRLQHELEEYAREVPEGKLIQLRDSAGNLLLPTDANVQFGRETTAWPAGPYTIRRNGNSYRIATGTLQSGGARYEMFVGSSLDDVQAILRDFRNLLLLLVAPVIGIACLGGYWLSRRALRPVDEITAVARSISLQNLSGRIAVPRTGDALQRMSETWNEVLQRLESSVKRMRQFTADASHELRTPLAVIRATAELALRRERDAEDYRNSLRNIEREADHMTQLTESLLTLARADSGFLEMPLHRTDVNSLAAAVVQQNEALAATKEIRLAAVTGVRPAFALANDSAIRRLLTILVDNALKYTPAGGEVTVSVEPTHGGAAISVKDTGEGIAAKELPLIFDRFYRADPARGGGSGFGLGLSIALAIAQAHGTTIEVESAPSAGSRFSLELKA